MFKHHNHGAESIPGPCQQQNRYVTREKRSASQPQFQHSLKFINIFSLFVFTFLCSWSCRKIKFHKTFCPFLCLPSSAPLKTVFYNNSLCMTWGKFHFKTFEFLVFEPSHGLFTSLDFEGNFVPLLQAFSFIVKNFQYFSSLFARIYCQGYRLELGRRGNSCLRLCVGTIICGSMRANKNSFNFPSSFLLLCRKKLVVWQIFEKNLPLSRWYAALSFHHNKKWRFDGLICCRAMWARIRLSSCRSTKCYSIFLMPISSLTTPAHVFKWNKLSCLGGGSKRIQWTKGTWLQRRSWTNSRVLGMSLTPMALG